MLNLKDQTTPTTHLQSIELCPQQIFDKHIKIKTGYMMQLPNKEHQIHSTNQAVIQDWYYSEQVVVASLLFYQI